MKNQLTFLIGLVIIAVLVMKFTMFQLPYNETAVVTTFGQADDQSVLTEPGLKFRFPPPISQVRRYSKNLQLLEMPKRQVSTQDEHSVIVSTYVAWRIENPLKFFLKLKNIPDAESRIDSLLRSESVVSEFRLDQIVNTDSKQQKIAEIEQAMARRLAQHMIDQDYGIEIAQVGLRSIELPEDVTAKVFERMVNEREAMAEKTRAEGRSRAVTIKTDAESKRDRILAFANEYADGLRAKGDAEAAEIFSVFQQNPEFAEFQLRVKAIPKLLGGEDSVSTLFLPRDWLDPRRLFEQTEQDDRP